MEKVEAVLRVARDISYDAKSGIDIRKVNDLEQSDVISDSHQEALVSYHMYLGSRALLLGIQLAQAKDEAERAKIVEQIGDVIPGFSGRMRQVEAENAEPKQVSYRNQLVPVRWGGMGK